MVNFKWINNIKYIDCSIMFPNWVHAKSVLTSYCDKISGWHISVDHTYQDGIIVVGLAQPMIFDVTSREYMPMWMAFPSDEQKVFLNIISNLTKDYLPPLDDMVYEKITTSVFNAIKNRIMQKQDAIQCAGGKKVIDELRSRLGILDETNNRLEEL